jgi:hypothetical protein
MKLKARIIASYLPQFHPVPENDKWWGNGFTEWTNVGKAKPLFPGHYQPKVPADLGYYDLRVPETREAQAKIAKAHGIEGFCYWHYWFGNGKRLLERPFEEVLASGSPDFPFCLGWANETWQGFEYDANGRIPLIEQLYPGDDDYIRHFNESILPAISDDRYIRVDNKPLILIFRPSNFPDTRHFIDLWQELAIKNGFEGIHFVGQTYHLEEVEKILQNGYDAVNIVRLKYCYSQDNRKISVLKRKLSKLPNIVEYKDIIDALVGEEDYRENFYPTLMPNYDHSPRTGNRGLILHDSTPKLFSKHMQDVMSAIQDKSLEHKIVFLKSWNEWAEGNYVEPDLRYGLKYLEAIKNHLSK